MTFPADEPMSQAGRRAIDAISALAAPRRAAAAALQDFEDRRQHWIYRLGEELPLVDAPHWEYTFPDGHSAPTLAWGDLDEAFGDFVDGGEPDADVIPRWARSADPDSIDFEEQDVYAVMEKLRPEIAEDLVGVGHEITSRQAPLEDAFAPVRVCLDAWLAEVRGGSGGATAAEWGAIQKAWRTALTLPMRMAGGVLGVSSAAIARYETGSRTPSLPILTGLVAHLSEAGPGTKLDFTRNLAVVAKIFGVEPEIANFEDDLPEPELIASIEDQLESLSETQLRFINALVADRGDLGRFMAWANTAPIPLLLATAAAVKNK